MKGCLQTHHLIQYCWRVEVSTVVTIEESAECNNRSSSCVVSYLSIWNNWNWNNWSRAAVAVAKWWRVAVNLDSCRTQGLPHDLLATLCQRSSPFVSRSRGGQSPSVTNTQVGIGRSERTQKQREGQLVQSVFVHASSSHCSGYQWTGTGAKLGQVLGQTYFSVQWTPRCDSWRSLAQNKEKKGGYLMFIFRCLCAVARTFF